MNVRLQGDNDESDRKIEVDSPRNEIVINEALVSEISRLQSLLEEEKEKRVKLAKKLEIENILNLNKKIIELQDTTKDPDLRRLLPQLPTLFPISEYEAARLNELSKLQLFLRNRPILEIEGILEHFAHTIKETFPFEALIFEAMGSEEYRTLAGRIMQKNTNGDKILMNILDTEFQEFGHRKIGACQYVVHDPKTITFSDKELAPFVTSLQENPTLFETLAVYDPQLRQHIENSKRRNAWTSLMNILTGVKNQTNQEKRKITSIFEFFVFNGCSYVGAPIKSNGFCIGTIFLLHKNSSEFEIDWKRKSKIELIASEIEDVMEFYQSQYQ